jgi:hypothetical protein
MSLDLDDPLDRLLVLAQGHLQDLVSLERQPGDIETLHRSLEYAGTYITEIGVFLKNVPG